MNETVHTDSSNTKKSTQKLFARFVAGMVLGFLALGLVLLLLSYFKVISLGKHFSLPFSSNIQNSSSNNKAIAKVGEETIYQQDLETENKYYPNIKSKTDDIMLKKLEKDSIILQAAAQDGLIKLDSTIYNSSTKDYLKRVRTVAAVGKMISDKQSKFTGSFVSIWFYNNSKPTPLSISDPQKANATALAKLQPIYEAVKSRKMTIEQAGQKLKADASLAQLDIAYKSNALGKFSVAINDKITFDKVFDAKIKALRPGQVTELYLGQDTNIQTRKLVDAIYMFAQVSEIKQGNTDNFASWYTKKEKDYAITTY